MNPGNAGFEEIIQSTYVDKTGLIGMHQLESFQKYKKYLEFLRTFFKGSRTTDRIFAVAHMTGILPIKKDGLQSAMLNFREFMMVKPRKFGEYVVFMEEEVRKLCRDNDADFNMMKEWCDGYFFRM